MIDPWIVHRFVHGGDQLSMTLLEFKRQICVSYLKGSENGVTSGRRKASVPSNNPPGVRFDQRALFAETRNEDARINHVLVNQEPIVKMHCNFMH